MIIRTWRGRATPASAPAYIEHFEHNVLPALRGISGFLGASLLREDRVDVVELLVLTRWASMDAIRAFAGDDPSRAVVEPEAQAVLVSFDRTVSHYTVVTET